MIPPQELRNKSFARSSKGYDIDEVNEYVDFIIEQYSRIFAQCDKYDKKLRIVSSRISEIQNEEETIHKLYASAQKNCDRMEAEAEEEAKKTVLRAREEAENIISQAREKAQSALSSIENKASSLIDATQEKSDALLLSARTRCTKLLGDFKKEISAQRENILSITTISEEFNSKLLSMYKNHLNLLNENTYIPVVDLAGLTESKLFESVMLEIKNDAVEIAKKSQGVEYDFEKELEILRSGGDFVYDVGEKDIRETQDKHDIYDRYKNITNTDIYSEDDDEYNEDEEDDSDIKIAGSYERESVTDTEEDDEDEDIKVFAGTKSGIYDSGPSDSENSAEYQNSAAYYVNDESEDDDNIYHEEPMATYDSDDYEYSDNSNKSYDSKYDENDGGESYSDEVYGIDGDDDPEEYYDESLSDDQDEMYEDEEDEEEQNKGSKGFLGFFRGNKNKKKTKKGSRRKHDVDEDDEENGLDIFEDMEDDD